MKKGKGILLLVLAAAQFMVVLDSSIVNVALPSILKGLSFSPENLQWVVTAYILAFGGFLLLGGRAADLFGRRRIFLIGLIGFTAGSMLAGAAQTEMMMIVSRALQGLTAAFMSPAALSILLTEYKEGKERNRALGVWGAVAGGGAAAGLILGGLLTEYFGWRWDFIVNLPVGIALVIMTFKYVPVHKSTATHRNLDLAGAILVTAGLMALVFGITKAPEWGWTSVETIAWLGSALVLLVAFVFNEHRAKHPLVDLKIFRIRNLSGANIAQLFITAGMMSMFYFISLYVQTVLGYKSLHTGVSFLPFAATIAVMSTLAPRIIAKIGYKPLVVAGPIIMSVGLFIMSNITVADSYLTVVLPGMVIMAFGAGLTFISISIAATSGVAKNESGLASGILNTSQQIGGAIGLAILSGVAATAASNAGTADLRAATVSGYHSAILVAAAFAFVAGIIALFVIQHRSKNDGAAPNDAPIIAGH